MTRPFACQKLPIRLSGCHHELKLWPFICGKLTLDQRFLLYERPTEVASHHAPASRDGHGDQLAYFSHHCATQAAWARPAVVESASSTWLPEMHQIAHTPHKKATLG